MADLSPAAQAVLNAALPAYDEEHLYVATAEQHASMIAAAALRAAVDQVVPEDCLDHQSNDSEWQTGFIDANSRTRAELLAIADELEFYGQA